MIALLLVSSLNLFATAARACEPDLLRTQASSDQPVVYQTVKMSRRYWGESRGLSLMAHWNGFGVRYLTADESADLEARHDGQTWRYVKSGERVVDHHEHLSYLVMDAWGRIYLGAGAYDRYHHSSVTNGGPVAAAGVVTFDEAGNLRIFTDVTGHYFREFAKVPDLNRRNLWAELERRGVGTSGLRYVPFDGAHERIGFIDRLVTRFLGDR